MKVANAASYHGALSLLLPRQSPFPCGVRKLMRPLIPLRLNLMMTIFFRIVIAHLTDKFSLASHFGSFDGQHSYRCCLVILLRRRTTATNAGETHAEHQN